MTPQDKEGHNFNMKKRMTQKSPFSKQSSNMIGHGIKTRQGRQSTDIVHEGRKISVSYTPVPAAGMSNRRGSQPLGSKMTETKEMAAKFMQPIVPALPLN